MTSLPNFSEIVIQVPLRDDVLLEVGSCGESQ
jgi:hypothetical protein